MTATTQTPAAETPVAGSRAPGSRKEDARLITGQTNWTDNLTLPGMLHLAFLRSPFAHAKINSVDVAGALNIPGVVAAFSGADFAADAGQPAVRLAGDRGHRDPGAPGDGRRRGPLCR